MSEEKKEEYQTVQIDHIDEQTVEEQNMCIICRDDENKEELYKMKCCECYYHKPCFEEYYKNFEINKKCIMCNRNLIIEYKTIYYCKNNKPFNYLIFELLIIGLFVSSIEIYTNNLCKNVEDYKNYCDIKYVSVIISLGIINIAINSCIIFMIFVTNVIFPDDIIYNYRFFIYKKYTNFIKIIVLLIFIILFYIKDFNNENKNKIFCYTISLFVFLELTIIGLIILYYFIYFIKKNIHEICNYCFIGKKK
jgi:hypothetical protein